MKSYKKISFTISILFAIFLTSLSEALASDLIKNNWVSGKPLLYTNAWHTSFTYNNKLNILGGATTHTTQNISTSNIDNDGNLNSWIISGNLPTSLYWHSMAKKENFIYILGGATYPPANSTNMVYRGTLYGDILLNWSPTSPLPKALSLGDSTIVGNKIYYSGGTSADFSFISSKVYIADINTDGTIGSWSETTPLPSPLFGHGMIETGSKIIVIGGRTSFLAASDKTYEADINPDGTLRSWVEKSPIPQPNANFGIAKSANTVFIVGGTNYPNNTPQNLNNVYYTNIHPDGSLGTWTESQNKLPKATGAGSLAATDTHLYFTGGFNTSYTNEVWIAETQTDNSTPLPSLNVPDIKQYTPPWNTQIYDNATTWSTNPTIQRWGCALTSASMVLQYYGHIVFPDILNNWLNSQPDGYLRNGFLNWLAISRYTKQYDTENSPTLKYKRLPKDTSNLISELKQGRPGILEEPGHFIVAKSQLPTTFGINDPAYSDRPDLTSYSNSFQSIGSYQPTHTDLSYILLTVNPNITISVYDPDGNPIENSSYIEQPLVDDTNPSSTNGQPLKIFLYSTPSQGKYTVELTGEPSNYTFDSYLYNNSGGVSMFSRSGLIDRDQKDLFEVTIGEKNVTKSIITFSSILQDIDTAWNLKLIPNLQIYKLIKLEVQLAQKLYTNSDLQAAKSLLSIARLHLKLAHPPFSVDKNVSELLQNNIQTLSDSITQNSQESL